MAKLPPGSWEGSDVRQADIDWLIQTHRVAPELICHRPDTKTVPVPEPGERVVFLTHFERGFGLPASNFFCQFIDFFSLQPHHLPANCIVSLSAFSGFMEGYFGLWPTVEAWAKFFHLRKQTIPGSDPKAMVVCGSVSISPRGNSILPRIHGLETVKKWQRSLLYGKSAECHDALNLPEYQPTPPIAEVNFKYSPAETEELRIMDNILEDFIKRKFCSDDLLRVFVACRVSPLQQREHKICHMGGVLDPMRISRHDLYQVAVKRRVKSIASSEQEDEWNWGVKPYYREHAAP